MAFDEWLGAADTYGRFIMQYLYHLAVIAFIIQLSAASPLVSELSL